MLPLKLRKCGNYKKNYFSNHSIKKQNKIYLKITRAVPAFFLLIVSHKLFLDNGMLCRISQHVSSQDRLTCLWWDDLAT